MPTEEEIIRAKIAELALEYDEVNAYQNELRSMLEMLGRLLPVKKPDPKDPTKEVEEFQINLGTGEIFTQEEHDAVLAKMLEKSKALKKKADKLKKP